MQAKREGTCEMRFTATIKGGQIIWHDIRGLNTFLSQTKGDAYIDIKVAKTRNISQNNYYWSILRGWNKEYKGTPEELHKICKDKFNIDSTSDFTVEEFTEYIDKVLRYASEEGGYAHPDPTRLP